jgi:hypothetical protein
VKLQDIVRPGTCGSLEVSVSSNRIVVGETTPATPQRRLAGFNAFQYPRIGSLSVKLRLRQWPCKQDRDYRVSVSSNRIVVGETPLSGIQPVSRIGSLSVKPGSPTDFLVVSVSSNRIVVGETHLPTMADNGAEAAGKFQYPRIGSLSVKHRPVPRLGAYTVSVLRSVAPPAACDVSVSSNRIVVGETTWPALHDTPCQRVFQYPRMRVGHDPPSCYAFS